jgi:CheY-like chemotaxis protein
MKNTGSLKLLIVDDNASSRRLIKTFLAELDCKVYDAAMVLNLQQRTIRTGRILFWWMLK